MDVCNPQSVSSSYTVWTSFVLRSTICMLHKNTDCGVNIIIIITQMVCSVHISTLLGAQDANPETPGQAPFSFTISVLGSFTFITQQTGPTALRPIRRTKQLWLSVLLKDTSATTGQAGIRTHIQTNTRT